MNRETVMSGKGHSRGNAKSAGTGDMPIPGLVTSRRQPRPKKKAEPERVQPVFDLKAEVKALKAAQAAAAAAKEAKEKRKRERSREKSRSHSPHRRRARSSSSEKSSEDRAAKKREQEEKAEKEQEEEEERLRKLTEERWKAAQAEREARQREEMRLAEERRLKDEQRHQDRKKKLKGAFATGDSDEEDEQEKKKRELAERLKRQAKAESLRPSEALSAVSKPERSSTSTTVASDLAIHSSGKSSQDAISIRSQLADPAGSRNFTAGEVAEKYKLLQEMKRRFRRTEFGGEGGRDKPRNRSRSRQKRRSRSKSTSKYDSLWIRPGAR